MILRSRSTELYSNRHYVTQADSFPSLGCRGPFLMIICLQPTVTAVTRLSLPDNRAHQWQASH